MNATEVMDELTYQINAETVEAIQELVNRCVSKDGMKFKSQLKIDTDTSTMRLIQKIDLWLALET